MPWYEDEDDQTDIQFFKYLCIDNQSHMYTVYM